MMGQSAWITERMATQDTASMNADTRYEVRHHLAYRRIAPLPATPHLGAF